MGAELNAVCNCNSDSRSDTNAIQNGEVIYVYKLKYYI